MQKARGQGQSLQFATQNKTLSAYRERGHRRLAARTFQEKCWSCIWGCRMPVEMIDPNKTAIERSTAKVVRGLKMEKPKRRMSKDKHPVWALLTALVVMVSAPPCRAQQVT